MILSGFFIYINFYLFVNTAVGQYASQLLRKITLAKRKDLLHLSKIEDTCSKLFCNKLFKVVEHQYGFIIFFWCNQNLESAFLIESLCSPGCIDCYVSYVSASGVVAMGKPFF